METCQWNKISCKQISTN